jgi:hypothetical protein
VLVLKSVTVLRYVLVTKSVIVFVTSCSLVTV